MIVVFTGNGKGKTTASLGAAVRAVGRGQKVLMVQFIKGPWKSGEDFVEVKKRKAQGTSEGGSFELKKFGLGFVGILGDQLPREEHQKAAQQALVYIKEAAFAEASASQGAAYDMIILDEVNVAVSLKLLQVNDVMEVLRNVGEDKIVILTGRDAPQEFIDRADLVTEMKEIKHPFNRGKMGKINVEF